MQKAGTRWPIVLLDYMMPEMDGLTLAKRIREMPGGNEATLIILTSDIQKAERERARSAGIQATLLKPVRQSDLYNAIAESQGESGFVREPEQLGEAQVRSGSINLLLAEDNLVNQRVAIGLLEREGHTVTAVGDGSDAVEEVSKGDYDIVLMDLQMPEIDGFEATKRIRALGGTDSEIPIIALTAHAMKGDRERCLEAGMNGYVAKPIQPELLYSEIARVQGQGSVASEGPTVPDGQRILDREDLMSRLQGDLELLSDVVDIFQNELPTHLRELKEGVDAGDEKRIRETAHRLKGAGGNLSSIPAYKMALELEMA